MRADALLRHGYTLGGVETLARHAVMGNRQYWSGGNRLDQHDLARFAILEALYTADKQPQPVDLLRAGQRALSRDKEVELRTHGIPVSMSETGAHFATYWLSERAAGTHEGHVVEVLALRQILPTLPENHQRAILALAATGDQRKAAALLGVGDNTFTTWLTRGRTAFRALWHEGEVPSGSWGRDRRPSSPHSKASAVGRIRRRARDSSSQAARTQLHSLTEGAQS